MILSINIVSQKQKQSLRETHYQTDSKAIFK